MPRKTWVDQRKDGKKDRVPTVKSDAPPGAKRRIEQLEEDVEFLKEKIEEIFSWLGALEKTVTDDLYLRDELERELNGLREYVSGFEEGFGEVETEDGGEDLGEAETGGGDSETREGGPEADGYSSAGVGTEAETEAPEEE